MTTYSAPRAYARGIHTVAVTCGARTSSNHFIHDGVVWEAFSEGDLDTYLSTGTARAHAQLDRLADLSHPYHERDEEKLRFMIDSLLYVRHTRDSIENL